MTDRITALRALGPKADLILLLEELIQIVGDNAVEILLRHDPNAGVLRRQMTRQAHNAPLRNMLAALIAQEAGE